MNASFDCMNLLLDCMNLLLDCMNVLLDCMNVFLDCMNLLFDCMNLFLEDTKKKHNIEISIKTINKVEPRPKVRSEAKNHPKSCSKDAP